MDLVNRFSQSGGSQRPDEASGFSRIFSRRTAGLLPLVVLCLWINVFALAFGVATDFGRYADVDLTDSPIKVHIAEYLRTGQLYLDVDKPPYDPLLYGPLGYVILSVPYRIAPRIDCSPQNALRFAILSFFIGSLALVYFVSRRLGASAGVSTVALLFAASGIEMRFWPVTIRPDFLALALSLTGLWICLGSSRRKSLLLAAVCAGVAFLCKQTYIAFPAAVFLWLLFQRRFLAALEWCVAVAAVAIAGYGYFILRNPYAWQNFAVIARPVLEYREGLRIAAHALLEAKVVFAVFGAYFLWRDRTEKLPLILIYLATALCTALLTIPQVGGNTNYFFEFWAIASILAAQGLFHLSGLLEKSPAPVAALVTLLTLLFLLPTFHHELAEFPETWQQIRLNREGRARWRQMQEVLSGKRLLSFEPAIALWSRVVELPQPFLNSVMEYRGTWSAAPIVRNVHSGVYDAFIAEDSGDEEMIRGLHTAPPTIFAAVKQRYTPACEFNGLTIWLPPHSDPGFYRNLVQAGCVPDASSRSGVKRN